MSITAQLPPIALAQASAGLRALAQASGQTVEARVLAQNANGTTQVQIGRQVLSLMLPQPHPAGTTLTLSVQQADGQLRLALIEVRPPGLPSAGMPNMTTAPATSVQLSAAALASSAASPAISPGAMPGGSPVSPAPGVTGQVPPTTSPGTGAIASGVSGEPGAGVRGIPAAPFVGPAPLYQPSIGPSAKASIPPGVPTASVSASVLTPPVATALPLQGGNAALTAASPPPTVGSPPTGPVRAQAGTSAPLSVNAPVADPVTTAVTPAPTGARVAVPYVVAAPAVASVLLTGLASSAATSLPPVGQAVSAGTVGQHAPSPNMPGTNAAPGAPAQIPPQVTQPSSPQAALAQMVQQALPRQDSIIGLTTALTSIAGKVALPEPVAKAAQQVLAARVPLDGVKLSGALIRTAIQQSGIFQEAALAGGQARDGDLKSALLTLRQGLGTWLGKQAPVAQVGSVPPPIRGQVPRARAGEGPPMDQPDDPAEVGKLLLERTDAALSRLRLHQNASLPDPNPMRQDAQWSMDLPVIVAGQQQILQMQIQRDAEQETERTEERSWQVRFAINLAERGEVGAQISLRAKNTSVLLWADQEATAVSMATAVEELRGELAEVGLVPGAIVVRAGAPSEQPAQPPGQVGHVVDATR